MNTDAYVGFLVTAVVIPSIIAVILVPLRWKFSKLVQAPTDFMVVFLTMDFVIFYENDANFINLTRGDWELYFLGVCSLLMLYYSVRHMERKLKVVENVSGVMKNVPWLNLMMTWLGAIFILYMHFYAFKTIYS